MAHLNHNNIRKDLEALVKLLRKYHFEDSYTMELYRLENIIGSKELSMIYNTNDIVFNISTTGMQTQPVMKSLSVSIDLNYSLNAPLTYEDDIFSSYSLQLYIKGQREPAKPDEFNFFCWHLDRELTTEGNLIHPYYHFHAGGRKLSPYDIGDLVMIGSPRIPHPPMDLFLAIHFVILNFLNNKDFPEQKKILKDDDYVSIIDRAQKRILKPYFKTIAEDSGHNDFSRFSLFPLVV